jgi:folate-binding protein YgfZ
MMTATPDYTAAVTSAALFDTSTAGKLELTGPDAPMFLGNLCTNDMKNLPLGGGCEAYFCDSRAKVQFAAWIYHIKLGDGRHAMWVETTPGRNAELVKYLDRYLISEQVENADVTERFAQFHIAGPRAADMLAAAIGEAIPELPEFAHMERTFGASATCSIRRRDQLGVPGFDVVCLKERAEGVRGLLLSAGAIAGTPETFETLRIEAGTPVYGIDIDAERSVTQVGRFERAVSYSKGCFLGQEPIVMARDRTGHATRSFLGLKVLEGEPLAAGTRLFRDGQDVGEVTSSTYSPRLGKPVALGYLKWKNQDPGLTLVAETSAGRQSVEVVGLPPVPFVKSNS